MARSVLDIVIRLSRQGHADRETVKRLTKIKSSFSQVAMSAAAVTGTLYTVKKAFDFSKEGANLEFVEMRFNRLAESIGANSNVMTELKNVTRGLYSDTQLMAGAADLMGLGLANNTEELMRLMRVSSGLNMNMNQLVLTLTNMTTMRFDAIGVSVDGFKDRVKDLERAGYSAEKAFKEAFLQQAEMQLDRVGEAADSTAGSYMQLEAAVGNFMDTMKASAGESMEPAVGWFARYVSAAEEVKRSNEDMATGWYAAIPGIAGLIDAIKIFVQMGEGAQPFIDEVARGYVRWGVEAEAVTIATTEQIMSLDKLKSVISGPVSEATEAYKTKMEDLKAQLEETIAEEQKWTAPPEGSKKYDELKAKQDDLRAAIEETTAAYEAQAAQIMFNLAQGQIMASDLAETEKAKALAAIAESFGMVDAATARAMGYQGEWIQQLANGAINADQFAVRNEQLGEALFDVSLGAGQAGKSVADVTGALKTTPEAAATGAEALEDVNEEIGTLRDQAMDARQKVQGVKKDISDLNGATATATVNIVVNGSVPSFRGVGRIYNVNTGSYGGGGGGIPEYQHGGRLGSHGENIATVGERGFETIVKDRRGRWVVIPHEASKWMKAAGMLEGANQFGYGGIIGDSDIYVPPDYHEQIQREAEDNYRTTPYGGSYAASQIPGTSGDAGSSGASLQDIVQPTIAPLIETTEGAVKAVAQSQVVQSFEQRQTRGTIEKGDNAQVELLRELIDETKLTRDSQTTAFKTAVQQVMG